MDTNGIQLFVIAAEMLNISAAGRQLGLAPAVSSARLAKLEKQIGADLFHRSTRKVTLSLEGKDFLPFAKEILAQENAALAALGRGKEEVAGTLRFAASSSFTQLYIAPIIKDFLDAYPAINLQLKLSDTQMNLIEGGFDLALRNYVIEDSSLRARKLADDKRILCASPEYLERFGIPTSVEDLMAHQMIIFMDGPALNLLDSNGRSVGVFPPSDCKKRVVCDDGSSMRIATVAGTGISMNSCWSVHREIKDGSLIRVLPDYEIDDKSAIWLVYPKSNVLTAKVRVFIDFLLENIGDRPVWET